MTGCWDCGSEVAAHLARCAVCGWPAPPARPRRPFGGAVRVIFLMGVVILGVAVTMSLVLRTYAAAPPLGVAVPVDYRMIHLCERCDLGKGSPYRTDHCPGRPDSGR